MLNYSEYIHHILEREAAFSENSLILGMNNLRTDIVVYMLRKYLVSLDSTTELYSMYNALLSTVKDRQSEHIEKSIASAENVLNHAQAKYSKFKVGSSILARDGSIYTGVNVESSSYGLTICAERSALVTALSSGNTDIQMIVVCTDTTEPSSPCGACRQLLYDYAPNSIVLMRNLQGDEKIVFTKHLLPFAFSDSQLLV